MNTPPVSGTWFVRSEHELTPQIVEAAKDEMQSAAEAGQQIVVIEGIEFRWEPIKEVGLRKSCEKILTDHGYQIEGGDWYASSAGDWILRDLAAALRGDL